jgi:hypothetical protein
MLYPVELRAQPSTQFMPSLKLAQAKALFMAGASCGIKETRGTKREGEANTYKSEIAQMKSK